MKSNAIPLVMLLVAVVAMPVGAAAVPQGDVAQPAPMVAETQETDCTFPVTLTDATGTEVTVTEPPERIVAIGGSPSQIMWEIGVQDRVVGMPVQGYTSYLNGSEDKTDVLTEDGRSVDQEQVVALDPELVVLANIYSNETAQSLRNAGLTVYREGFPSSLTGIRDSIDTYGQLTGECENATSVNTAFNGSLDEISRSVEGEESPRVFYTFFNFTAGNGTFIDELITTAGGTNIAAEAGVNGFRQVNLELVAEQDPQVVVVPSGASVPMGEPWNSTTAYTERNIVRVDSNLVSQPAPRVVQPVGVMQDAFAAAIQETPDATTTDAATTDATTTPTATEESTLTATESDMDPQTPAADSSGDGAGFGLVAALVAITAAALLVARRD